MKIGFFPVMAGRRGGGPETYEIQLLRALWKVAPEHEYHVFCLDQAAADAFAMSGEGVYFHVLKPRNRFLSMTLSLPFALRRAGVDVLHATFTPPPWAPLRYVFTMHDTSMFDHPEFYPPMIRWRLNTLIRRGLSQSAVVLCISDYVRQAVRDRFAISDERLAVAWHGIEACYRPMDGDQARALVREYYELDGPYILYVGKFEKRKNVFGILNAFRRFVDRHGKDVHLVMAGKPDWNKAAVDREIEELGLQGLVVTPGYVPGDHLPALYSAARMFVFPSLWEGFGFPILEAMACGLPVVTSNTTGLAEVAGDAALLVDPRDCDAIAEAMARCHYDDALRCELIERGFERLRSFSWEQCARQTLAVYERCLNA